jgi:hypothetical protein
MGDFNAGVMVFGCSIVGLENGGRKPEGSTAGNPIFAAKNAAKMGHPARRFIARFPYLYFLIYILLHILFNIVFPQEVACLFGARLCYTRRRPLLAPEFV